jgi:hypothetical protein
MRVYTVHMRRPTLRPEQDVVLVKEGFSWPAFLLSFIWALCRRLWLVAAILLGAEVLIALVFAALRPDAWSQTAMSLGAAVIIGMLANDLHRWTLFRRGFLEVGVVTGDDIDAAERRFWDQRPNLAADLVR